MNVVIASSVYNQLSHVTSYRGISDYHSNKMLITRRAIKELHAQLNFTQLRFHCSKRHPGRTFHVVTTTNSSGDAVVRYFSGRTDVRPVSCGSFERMEDDNSRLATRCGEWELGKWSTENRYQDRLYNHVAYKSYGWHWILYDSSYSSPPRFDCDDELTAVSPGDFWNVFVR